MTSDSPATQTVTFFLLTFALTWAAWLTAAALASPGNTGFFGVHGPVFLIGVFAPALVALALTARNEGQPGVRALLARIGQWEVGARWYLFAVGFMVAVKLAAAFIHRAITGEWPPFGDTPWVVRLAAILVSTWAQAGEEIGWRGYALPRLAGRLGLGPASVVLGVIWALWHLPLFFLPDSGTDSQSFPVYMLHVAAISVAMAWLYWRTSGSLLLVMVMHASVNNTTGVVSAPVPAGAGPFALSGSLMAWLTVGLSWAAATVLLLQMRRAPIAALSSVGSREVRSHDD